MGGIDSILAVYQANNSLPKAQYATDAYQKLLMAKKQQDILFLVIGRLLKEIRDNDLYVDLDYDTFSDFVYSQELGFSGESAWMYIRVYEFYIEKLGLDDKYVATLPVSRLSMMIPVLKQMDTDEEMKDKIVEMTELRNPDFLMKVRQTKGNKPKVYFSEKMGKFIIEYYEDVSMLTNLGSYEEYQKR